MKKNGRVWCTKNHSVAVGHESHRESFEQEMDSSTPDEEWAALQQFVYNTAKTYLGKPDRKYQDCLDEIPTMDEMAKAIACLKMAKHLEEMEFLQK
ncbi:hypothetical protein NP493_1165g01002 [Ridgeia piscesae]|uniref:Uncharacterized protein n=1 Tax=Ridgeia piscesae TaxID=27915 RepID=A0AAD9NIR8_RIDPI|nr:hypothetical protein NP493_1165g01002 [Ridgeia piscesae]